MDESIKLKLLAGLPFEVKDICIIKPLTLKQIVTIGWEQYNLYLSNLIAEVSDYNITDIDLSQYTYWDILMSTMYYGNEENQEMIIKAISIFLGKGIFFDKKTCLFYTDEGKQIDKNIFDEIRQILKWQNCVEKDNKEKMANSKAEEIRKKILKGRQELNKKNKTEVTFDDLISVLAANGNNLNILNIWDLTMYQFNNQFNRMQMIEDYDINIRYLLAGAKKEDVDLKHYISPIKANSSL